MKSTRLLGFVAFLVGFLLWQPLSVAAQTPPHPLAQPRSQSPYGMDIFGPSWQWTFPREEAYPRLNGSIRVDQLDEAIRKSWAAGVRSARIAAWWCFLEPERDLYVWTDLDYAFQIASNYGIIPVPEIFFTPDWAAIGGLTGKNCIHSTVKNYPPINMEDWSDFLREMIRRYGAYGKNQVHDWEIWNEPDLWEFLYVPHDPANANVTTYAELVKRARVEIDRYDIGGRLLLGGLSDIYGPDFLRRLMALRGPLDIRRDVDIVTFHAFSNHDDKISRLKAPIDGMGYELWITELNTWGWSETVSPATFAVLWDKVHRYGITRSFWFKSWTTDWGPGIFSNRDPLWVPGPFNPSPLYETFRQQAFPHRLPSAPVPEWPPARSLQSPEARLVWHRPLENGTFPVVGYKVQLENTFYRGELYYHTPEVDAWVPATHLHFLPFQIHNRRIVPAAEAPTAADLTAPFTFVSPLPEAPEPGDTASATDAVAPTAAEPTAGAVVPPLDRSSYRLPASLPPGVYYWRVAAVDSQGNVGPYSAPRQILIGPGERRLFLPMLLTGN